MQTTTQNKNQNWARPILALLATTTLLAVGGCQTNTGTGALVGGATGATLGAIIGHNSRLGTGGGAVLGGAIGAVTGAAIGHEADREQWREDHAYVELNDPYWREHGWVFVGYDAGNRPIYERAVGYDAYGRPVYERRVFVQYAAPAPPPPGTTIYGPPPAAAAPQAATAGTSP